MKQITIILALLLLTAIFAACTTTTTNFAAHTTTTTTKGDNMSDIAVFKTNKGTFEVQLNKDKAPITVANFEKYVNDGFYKGTVFHRVMKGFMVQGGGFLENGSQKKTMAPIKLESDNGLKNKVGTIAMARTQDPNSATSQFFINTVDNNFLNYAPGNDGYAVFGKVISGMDVIKQIESVQTTTKKRMQDWPVDNIVIEDAYMKK